MSQPTHRHDLAHRGLVPADQLATGALADGDVPTLVAGVPTWAPPAGTLSDHGVITYLDGVVAAAPATPGAGNLRIYAKTGKVLAVKDDNGIETTFGSGAPDIGTIVVCFDGGGAVLTPKVQDVYLPAGGTLDGWELLADQAATATITVKAAAFGAYPPTASITGGSDPALASTATASDNTLATWTKPFAAATCLRFTLSAVTLATRLFLILTYTR